MKRMLFIMLPIALMATVVHGCGGGNSDFRASLVLTTTGLDDGGFNDSGKAGLDRAQEQLGISESIYEPETEADYQPMLQQSGEQDDLTIALGFDAADDVGVVATGLPQSKFVIIDAIVDASNAISVVFKEEQGSYLVGAIAGLMTTTNRVAFIGGEDTPVIRKFEAGFRAGVAAVNSNATISSVYSGTFSDQLKGRELAIAEYERGADIIYQAAGLTGVGVFDAAKEKGTGYWVIGVDVDQSFFAPENTLASMVKRVDVAVYNSIRTVKEVGFEPGVVIYDLSNEGLSIASTSYVPASVLARTEELRQGIINGQIVVPTS